MKLLPFYLGEDGVEISIPSQHVNKIVESLLLPSHESVQLAGLGARDSLRLEAGLCLYGSDIDQTTTPIEAGLAWLVGMKDINFIISSELTKNISFYQNDLQENAAEQK